MKRIHTAWIEQHLSFDSEQERTEYIEKQIQTAARKYQPDIQIVSVSLGGDKRYYLQIRKPYNHCTMPMMPK